jgi:hypothetical protein
VLYLHDGWYAVWVSGSRWEARSPSGQTTEMADAPESVRAVFKFSGLEALTQDPERLRAVARAHPWAIPAELRHAIRRGLLVYKFAPLELGTRVLPV